MSPKRSMKAVASGAGRADPLTATMRGRCSSQAPWSCSSPRSSQRCSITGTANTASQRSRSTMASAGAASKRRVSTTGEPCSTASSSPALPQVCSSGAAMNTGSPAFNGIADSTAATGVSPLGFGRRAPFGGPVVPDVSTIVRPSVGRSGRVPGPLRAISSSTVGRSTGPSCQPMTIVVSSGSASTLSPMSASATTRRIFCSSATVASCEAGRPVLSSTTSAPSLATATCTSTAPRWLRHSTPTRAPGSTPRPASERASRSVRRENSA